MCPKIRLFSFRLEENLFSGGEVYEILIVLYMLCNVHDGCVCVCVCVFVYIYLYMYNIFVYM